MGVKVYAESGLITTSKGFDGGHLCHSCRDRVSVVYKRKDALWVCARCADPREVLMFVEGEDEDGEAPE